MVIERMQSPANSEPDFSAFESDEVEALYTELFVDLYTGVADDLRRLRDAIRESNAELVDALQRFNDCLEALARHPVRTGRPAAGSMASPPR